MNEMEKRRLSFAARALRTARNQRRADLATTRETIDEELSTYRGQGALELERRIAPVLNTASARRLLSHVDVEDRYGKEHRVEVAEAKLKEKYEKRPSVRALKKQKNKGMSGPSL